MKDTWQKAYLANLPSEVFLVGNPGLSLRAHSDIPADRKRKKYSMQTNELWRSEGSSSARDQLRELHQQLARRRSGGITTSEMSEEKGTQHH